MNDLQVSINSSAALNTPSNKTDSATNNLADSEKTAEKSVSLFSSKKYRSSHSSRKNKKSAVDMISNRYYNSNVAGDHLNFLPIRPQNNYQLNEESTEKTAEATNKENGSNTPTQGIAELINTYNLLENNSKQHSIKMKRPKSAFFQPQTHAAHKPMAPPPPTLLDKNATVKSLMFQRENVDTGGDGSGYSSLSSNPYVKMKHLSRRDLKQAKDSDSTSNSINTINSSSSDFISNLNNLNKLFSQQITVKSTDDTTSEDSITPANSSSSPILLDLNNKIKSLNNSKKINKIHNLNNNNNDNNNNKAIHFSHR